MAHALSLVYGHIKFIDDLSRCCAVQALNARAIAEAVLLAYHLGAHRPSSTLYSEELGCISGTCRPSTSNEQHCTEFISRSNERRPYRERDMA